VATTWEYNVLDVAGEEYSDIRTTLNQLGAEGWELVCTTESEESVCTLWLKRPIQADGKYYLNP
jgi:hypothetical protein